MREDSTIPLGFPFGRWVQQPVMRVEATGDNPSRAKQAAAKGLRRRNCRYKLLQGLKPGIELIGFIGPTEVVPLLQSRQDLNPMSFSAAFRGHARLWTLFVCLAASGAMGIQGQTAPEQPAETDRVVLDRVVAVVNNQAILASDIDDEMLLSVLDPGRGGLAKLTQAAALEQLIARALIQQQIRQEDVEQAAPPQSEVDARLKEIRKEIPACVRANCVSDAGWKMFLSAHGLTQQRVEVYLRFRLEILRFIEQRFRQGISISQEEIELYYKKTLMPQYAKGEAIPPVEEVAQRIQEILLQQQVNALFDDWLSNLRKQGDIEVLDPALETPAATPAATGSATGGEKGSQ